MLALQRGDRGSRTVKTSTSFGARGSSSTVLTNRPAFRSRHFGAQRAPRESNRIRELALQGVRRDFELHAPNMQTSLAGKQREANEKGRLPHHGECEGESCLHQIVVAAAAPPAEKPRDFYEDPVLVGVWATAGKPEATYKYDFRLE